MSFDTTSRGSYWLDVARLGGDASSTVVSTPPGIDCGPKCSALFGSDTVVTLAARTTNGSSFLFAGWDRGGCTGRARECAVTVRGPTIVTAAFSPLLNNIVFATSSSFATNRGSAIAYDRDCNAAASAAGINDAAGTSYVR